MGNINHNAFAIVELNDHTILVISRTRSAWQLLGVNCIRVHAQAVEHFQSCTQCPQTLFRAPLDAPLA
jgi:hypothetical protein